MFGRDSAMRGQEAVLDRDGEHRAVAAKHLPRYLGAFAWRFNRRFVLKAIHERLAIAAAATPPMPYRLLELAEDRW